MIQQAKTLQLHACNLIYETCFGAGKQEQHEAAVEAVCSSPMPVNASDVRKLDPILAEQTAMQDNDPLVQHMR